MFSPEGLTVPNLVAVLLKKSKWLFSGRVELEKRLQLRRYAAKVCLSPKRTNSLCQRTIPAIIIDFPGSHSKTVGLNISSLYWHAQVSRFRVLFTCSSGVYSTGVCSTVLCSTGECV